MDVWIVKIWPTEYSLVGRKARKYSAPLASVDDIGLNVTFTLDYISMNICRHFKVASCSTIFFMNTSALVFIAARFGGTSDKLKREN